MLSSTKYAIKILHLPTSLFSHRYIEHKRCIAINKIFQININKLIPI